MQLPQLLSWFICLELPPRRRLPQGLQDLGRQRRRWNAQVLLKAQQELKHFCLSEVATQNVWSRANRNGMEDMHDVLSPFELWKSCLICLWCAHLFFLEKCIKTWFWISEICGINLSVLQHDVLKGLGTANTIIPPRLLCVCVGVMIAITSCHPPTALEADMYRYNYNYTSKKSVITIYSNSPKSKPTLSIVPMVETTSDLVRGAAFHTKAQLDSQLHQLQREAALLLSPYDIHKVLTTSPTQRDRFVGCYEMWLGKHPWVTCYPRIAHEIDVSLNLCPKHCPSFEAEHCIKILAAYLRPSGIFKVSIMEAVEADSKLSNAWMAPKRMISSTFSK